MKILMFVSNPFTHDPRVFAEAKSLVKGGHHVTVIACDRKKENPPRQNADGIEIVRIRPRAPQRYYLGSPFWNGFSPLSWQWQAYSQAMVLNRDGVFDVIHCHDFDSLIVGVGLKRKLGVPLIYDAHEIYGYMAARDFPLWVGNMFLRLEKWLIRKVDYIVTVNEPLESYFSNITDKPISVIMNCKPLQGREYEPPNNGDRFTVLYIGVLHKGRLVPMLLDVVKELLDVYCIIGGIGDAGYVGALKEKCDTAANADFIGQVPFDQVIPMTKKADAVFLMVSPQDRNNRIGLGNKQFEAMVCGRPIICTKGTYSGEMTEREDVGLTVEATKEALKQAIIKLRDEPELRERLGRNALKAAITKYNWESQEKRLLELYENIDVRFQPIHQ